MGSSIKHQIKRIHHLLPPQIRDSYRFIIRFIQKLSQYYLPVHRYLCTDDETGTSFSLVHVGWDMKLLYYWLGRLSANHQVQASRKRILSWKVRGYLNTHRKDIDLALVETSEKASDQVYPDGFLLPRWMEIVANIELAFQKSRVKDIQRSIRKHKLEFEIREGMESFNLFYHKMYAPFTLKRHGESADVADYKHFSAKYRKEGALLFFVLHQQEPVASAYIEYTGKNYRVSAFGILEGDENIHKMGVLGALYYQVMKYAQSRGAESVLLGNTMSAALDGAAEFKRLIGGVPYLKDLEGKQKYFFLPLNYDEPLFLALESNPLYYLRDGKLELAIYTRADVPECKEGFFRLLGRLKTEQVGRSRIYYRGHSGYISEWIKEKGLENMELIKVPETQG